MRIIVTATALGLGLVGLSVTAAGQAAMNRMHTNIPPQALAPALRSLAKEFNFQIVFASKDVASLRTHGVVGEFGADEALQRALSGTGMTFRHVDSHTITVLSAATAATSPSGPGASADGPSAPSQNDGKEGKRSSSGGFPVARAASPGSSGNASVVSSAASQAASSAAAQLGEVVVTAEKRTERLLDVPVPVTAVGADRLSGSHQTRLRDYFEDVPGFIVSPGPSAGNQQMLTIRGISSGAFGNPTVGVTVDDVPFGAFTREYAPDIDPSDLERVEVLRGPQGTLYGASSMGGLVKFVTVDPSTKALTGQIQAGTEDIENGSRLGDTFSGFINVPLTQTMAARASLFTREDPGYIDNSGLGIKGVNQDRASGGRLSFLWRFAQSFTLKLSALYQHTKANGLGEVDLVPGLGDLQQNYIRGVGGYDQTIEAYSANVHGKVGMVDLTSVTGYSGYDYSTSNDYTYLYGPLAAKAFAVTGAPIFATGNQDKFSQEFRAMVPFGERFEWLIGAFYTHEHTPLLETISAENTQTGSLVGDLTSLNIPIEYNEYAAFTDLTVHFTTRFSIQFGGRESHLEEIADPVFESGALLQAPIILAGIRSTPNVFTYLVTPQYTVSRHLMLYSRAASGYRPGRANSFNPDPSIPRSSVPDKTENYELGAKGDALDGALTFDASLYYISFKNIQISLLDPKDALSYYANGSNAKSEGAELSIAASPAAGLKVAAWGSYDDVMLTQGFPPNTAAYGPTGSRLPYSARLSGNLSVDQEFPLGGEISGFVGATESYVGSRLGTFVATPQRAYYPAYAKLDLRAGVRDDTWTLTLYATNATNKRGLLGGGAGNYPPYAYLDIQPRTVGITVARRFE